MTTPHEKPCLVAAGQGFTVLYRGRSLYSRYNPQKTVVQTVTDMPLLPNTLVLCVSPCLWYGLTELTGRLPCDCFLLGVEADAALHALAADRLRALCEQQPSLTQNVALLDSGELHDIASIISTGTAREVRLPPPHRFRRVVAVELSGGAAFNAPLYQRLVRAAENAVATFWKNRLTLTKFGRLYARNLFRNLARLPSSIPFARLCRSVRKPLLLFGAGESAETTLKALPRAVFKQLYVIAVDAALPVLRAHGITPDCVVAVESQLAIETAYIGNTHTTPLLLADLVSRAQVTAHTAKSPAGSISYFFSAYTDAAFLQNLRAAHILPPTVPPLGSVGLTATYLALQLRSSDAVPVFVTGLDFSFSLGATHARGAPAHTARLATTDRLHQPQNIAAAFKYGARRVQGKAGEVFTDTALSGYANQFSTVFADAVNLYDIGQNGISLGIARASERELFLFLLSASANDATTASSGTATTDDDTATVSTKRRVRAYLAAEAAALTRLKALLVHGEAAGKTGMSAREEIAALLSSRDYLYVHFPDGYQCRADDLSFLKRVRSETDFFLKDITRAMSALESAAEQAGAGT